ncbi:DUF1115 domain protein [Flagelloscypha sp. PMI_526]|nr:DUF1115 domain protein [Flagelloscypha sp. PMI_526]
MFIRPKHPSWMSRTDFDMLLQGLPKLEDSEDFSSFAVESLEYIMQFCSQASLESLPSATPEIDLDNPVDSRIIRTWFLLPSLSTKSKRQDLVTYAQSFEMTGIILAGKPGLVILEHPSATSFDSYWSNIKSTSWADIPSSHKKVSERLREDAVHRAFEDMREMTRDKELGGQEALVGAKGNRNDMGGLEAWLEKKGLGGRMQKVLGADWTL